MKAYIIKFYTKTGNASIRMKANSRKALFHHVQYILRTTGVNNISLYIHDLREDKHVND